MNPITEHTSNPFLEKTLVKFIGLYKLTEATPSSLRDIPSYETIANAASIIDYSFPSYIASLHRCIREIQHAPIDPEADRLQKTHRVRLSHPEFECHCQTLILPDFHMKNTSHSTNNDDTNENDGDNVSDDENGHNQDENNDEEIDATKSRKKGTQQVSTQATQKGTKGGQKGSKNDSTTTKETKQTKSTYLLFAVTDFNFVVEYSISSFFKDFTTQLNYISQKEQSMTIQQHDKKFFSLLSQLYNRYLSRRKQTDQLINTYHANIKYQQELLKYQQQKNANQDPTTTTTTTTSTTTQPTPPSQSIPEPTKPDDEIPTITLLTTIPSINYHNIHTTPRSLHIESIHTQPDYQTILECINIPTNSEEMLQFARELTFELQRIQMKDNVVQFLKGKTHFLGIPFSIWNYVVAGTIQIVTMSAVFAFLFYIQYLFGEVEPIEK